ncbi:MULTISPECIES: hypothetical protein [unclassified Modestobacter]|uniref:hypothetical protein n=1 Tax=unclassified Modestobacter TaxID=2643866 RepID=UPI0022AB1FFB|nr:MULTISPECIES: hypothetical protein [unclassified Modestobacter]MCZ2825996.1 hypothetical protein [Modestobacter sp. VKM Ac-2981]MCZ2852939.1 hypothetical protein [Modestobacter sp. VKM Ac-2982]
MQPAERPIADETTLAKFVRHLVEVFRAAEIEKVDFRLGNRAEGTSTKLAVTTSSLKLVLVDRRLRVSKRGGEDVSVGSEPLRSPTRGIAPTDPPPRAVRASPLRGQK